MRLKPTEWAEARIRFGLTTTGCSVGIVDPENAPSVVRFVCRRNFLNRLIFDDNFCP
ncbi:hypothetical protein NIES2104_36700 [Leptolyngbya sp. NIES-2104]|nr:hypothetical protein NIES2104_36700 [Leptolyngbya sp. NIES-2104]